MNIVRGTVEFPSYGGMTLINVTENRFLISCFCYVPHVYAILGKI